MSSDTNDNFHSHIRRRHLPSLQALVCFEAAAREESFSRAATALCLTHSAVSRAIRLLESDFGTLLFERRGRSVFLTANGRKLAQAVGGGFDLIEKVCRELRNKDTEKRFTLACQPTLLMRWLIPQLPDFHARHPDIALQLVATSESAWEDSYDMAIRRNDIAWPADIDVSYLFPEKIGPVCRPERLPDFIAQNDGDTACSAQAVWLHTQTRADAWEVWTRRSGMSNNAASHRHFEHFYYSLQAAAAGLGLAIGPEQLVASDVQNGLLAAPFGFIEDGTGYYLLAAKHLANNEAKSHICNWLKSIATGVAP